MHNSYKPSSSSSSHNQNHEHHNHQPVLLVRDDSIMSKSAKMSTSSITEVSSLMTSTLGAGIFAKTNSSLKQSDQLRLKTYTDPSWTMRQQKMQQSQQSEQGQRESSEMTITNVTSTTSSSSSSTMMDKVSPSGASSSSSSSACSNTTAVDSGRDSFIADSSSPANSAMSGKYLVGLPFKSTNIALNHHHHNNQQTVILGSHNPQYLDTHC